MEQDLKDIWLNHINNADQFINLSLVTDTDLSSWFSPLINSIANDGTVPYLINTKERYRASPLASTIIWLSHENLLPIEVLDKMQNALLFLRDSNVPLDAQQPNGQKKPEDVNGWSLGEGVSVWSTSMAIIALLDPLGNGKAKANMYKSSILWLAAQHDPSTHGWAYQLSENCNVNAIMTALALRALALAIEPNNRAFFSFTPDEFRTICSSIQAGFKYLQSNCVVRKRKVYWTFNQIPNCAATTWALLALNQINLTDERIADECKSFYKSILKRALSFIISKMPRTPTKWADEQIVCEAGAKYRKQKNYYSYSATLLPQLFELGLSPFNPKVINQINWLLHSNIDNWKIEGYDKTSVCTFTYAMVLSAIFSWIRRVGKDFSLLLLQSDTTATKVEKVLTGFPISHGCSHILILKQRLYLMCIASSIVFLILFFLFGVNEKVSAISNMIVSLWFNSSADRHSIAINIISSFLYTLICVIFSIVVAFIGSVLKKWGAGHD